MFLRIKYLLKIKMKKSKRTIEANELEKPLTKYHKTSLDQHHTYLEPIISTPDKSHISQSQEEERAKWREKGKKVSFISHSGPVKWN